jgi:hypothetical protein
VGDDCATGVEKLQRRSHVTSVVSRLAFLVAIAFATVLLTDTGVASADNAYHTERLTFEAVASADNAYHTERLTFEAVGVSSGEWKSRFSMPGIAILLLAAVDDAEYSQTSGRCKSPS